MKVISLARARKAIDHLAGINGTVKFDKYVDDTINFKSNIRGNSLTFRDWLLNNYSYNSFSEEGVNNLSVVLLFIGEQLKLIN